MINEMLRVKVFPSMPQRVIRGVNLTLQQYDEFVQLAGRPAKDSLGRLIADPKYAALPDFARAEAIQDDQQDPKGGQESVFGDAPGFSEAHGQAAGRSDYGAVMGNGEERSLAHVEQG